MGEAAVFGAMLGIAIGSTLSVGRSVFLGRDSIFFWGYSVTLGFKGVWLAFAEVLLLDLLVFASLVKVRKRKD
jgi:hypothetical protein